MINSWRDGEVEPEVWIEDLKSSNGTFVRVCSPCALTFQINGERLKSRKLLQPGDEISLGHPATMENHDVQYIYRSVGSRDARYDVGSNSGGLDMIGEIYERYQMLER